MAVNEDNTILAISDNEGGVLSYNLDSKNDIVEKRYLENINQGSIWSIEFSKKEKNILYTIGEDNVIGKIES